MVAQAPRIESVLPAFLEFARGSVLVAHNAGFDVSFLKAAARSTGHPWPGFRVLDTVHLARQLVMKRRVAQPQALVAGRRLRGDDDARPPRAARRPRDRRRPARAARAGRQPRRPHPRGAVELHLAGHARAAPQAVPRRAPAAAAGRLHLQGRARSAPLRRHVAQHPRSRPVLLHRLRAAHPDGRDGRPRHEHPAHRVPDDARRRRSASCASSPSTSRATTDVRGSPSGSSGSS